MFKSIVRALIAIVPALAGGAAAQQPATALLEGALAYRMCASCHSLEPGVHLSGPSLAGMWGSEAASVAGFGRYTDALAALDAVWDEDTLNAWLAGPSAMAPGTTMAFAGIEDDQTRISLIAFLELAMAGNGAAKVVADGLISESIARGQVPSMLKDVPAEQLVTEIRHCGDAYHVTTASGDSFPFWEANVRLKIDTSDRGPAPGSVVLLRSGMAGDRMSVVFASLAELRDRLAERCS